MRVAVLITPDFSPGEQPALNARKMQARKKSSETRRLWAERGPSCNFLSTGESHFTFFEDHVTRHCRSRLPHAFASRLCSSSREAEQLAGELLCPRAIIGFWA